MIDNKEIKDSNTIMLLQYVRLNSLIQKKPAVIGRFHYLDF
jgi:hypothetical protein